MYSIVIAFVGATAADIPDANRRSGYGCQGQRPEARSSSCYGHASPAFESTTMYTTYGAPKSGGCFGGEGRGFAPLRNIAAAVADNHRDRVDGRQDARAARHGGETTYFVPASAVPVNTPAQAPVPQSKCPPVAKP